MLELQSGRFKISDNLVISHDKSYDDLIKLVPTSKTWDIKNGYKWVFFNEVVIDDLIFDIGVCFRDNKLFSIEFGFSEKQQQNISWDNWNEADELKRKDIYEQWLTKHLGTKRNFDWGKIAACYDPRGGGTTISIKY